MPGNIEALKANAHLAFPIDPSPDRRAIGYMAVIAHPQTFSVTPKNDLIGNIMNEKQKSFGHTNNYRSINKSGFQ